MTEPMSEERLQALKAMDACAESHMPWDEEYYTEGKIPSGHLTEACEEIDRLRAENERLRKEVWRLCGEVATMAADRA